MDACLANDQLRNLLLHQPGVDEQAQVAAHLEACTRCRERLESMAGVAEFATVLVDAAAHGQPPSDGLKAAIAHLRHAPSDVDSREEQVPMPPASRPGFIGELGGIQILRRIGQGAMGIVFEGLDPKLNRVVAVKVLSPRLATDAEARSRFLREARAVATLTHEHIVAIHAIDELGDLPFLVLQHIPGQSLANRLAERPQLTVDEIVRIGVQTGRGLAAAHARGLVHRDIKPANLLLETETGHLWIADFGLARAANLEAITSSGALAGTPAFMSPEQASGRDVDGRSDLFSLGVVLYLASSGRLPFEHASVFGLLDEIQKTNQAPLSKLRPDLPDWLCRIVGRLLEKRPERRIQTADELVAALEAGASSRFEKSVSSRGWLQHRRPLVAAACVALALAAVAMVVMWRPASPSSSDQRPRPESASITSPFRVAGRSDGFASLAEAVAAAADGEAIEILDDGPFPTPAVEVKGKRLTIRAAQGSRPRFEPLTSENELPRHFLETDSDLELEQLDIMWPVPHPKQFDGDTARGVVTSSAGTLIVRHCRITCGEFACCVATTGDEASLVNCHLIAAGACVGWKAGANRLHVSGCQLEGVTGIATFTKPAPKDVPGAAEISDNTFAVDRAWNDFLDSPRQRPIQISWVRNLVDCKQLMLFTYRLGRARPPADSPEDQIAIVRKRIAWTESANVYRQGCAYAASAPLRNHTTTTLFASIQDWFGFWDVADSGSIEGVIRFEPRSSEQVWQPLRIKAIEPASGTLPDRFGAGSSSNGP